MLLTLCDPPLCKFRKYFSRNVCFYLDGSSNFKIQICGPFSGYYCIIYNQLSIHCCGDELTLYSYESDILRRSPNPNLFISAYIFRPNFLPSLVCYFHPHYFRTSISVLIDNNPYCFYHSQNIFLNSYCESFSLSSIFTSA